MNDVTRWMTSHIEVFCNSINICYDLRKTREESKNITSDSSQGFNIFPERLPWNTHQISLHEHPTTSQVIACSYYIYIQLHVFLSLSLNIYIYIYNIYTVYINVMYASVAMATMQWQQCVFTYQHFRRLRLLHHRPPRRIHTLPRRPCNLHHQDWSSSRRCGLHTAWAWP